MDTSYLEAKGWLSRGERELLRDLAGGVPGDGTIINIGVEYGASLHCLRAGNKEARIVGVDIIGDERLEGDPGAEIVESTSRELYEGWDDSEVDLVFVDGDHSYMGVMFDCDWASALKVGGVIAFHDCYKPGTTKNHEVAIRVNDAVSEWARARTNFQEVDHVDSTRVFVRME